MKLTILDKCLDDIELHHLDHSDSKVFEALMNADLKVRLDDAAVLSSVSLMHFLAILAEEPTTGDVTIDNTGITFEANCFREAHECWAIIKNIAKLNGN